MRLRESCRGCAGFGVRADCQIPALARMQAAQSGNRVALCCEEVAYLHSASSNGRVEDQLRAALSGYKARLYLLLPLLADLVKLLLPPNHAHDLWL